MTLKELNYKYQQLQTKYGDPSLDSILYGGQLQNPKLCLIFMNPTGRNISSEKTWKGSKAPWIATKTVWDLFSKSKIFDEELKEEIYKRKPHEWDYKFTDKVYKEIENRGIYITNLAKCTQTDARPLSNSIFKKYIDLLHEELNIIQPKKIITFGNQVSKIFIGRPISVSKDRRKIFKVKIKSIEYSTLPVYYPVGQGRRNMDKAVEDIKWYLNC